MAWNRGAVDLEIISFDASGGQLSANVPMHVENVTINFAPWNANSSILAWSYKEICWTFILCDMLKKHTRTIFHFQLKILPSNLWRILFALSILRNIIEGKYLRYISSQQRIIWRGVWKKYVRVRRVDSLFFKR